MKRVEKTIFISYRRADEAWALAIYDRLKQRGFDVFIDYLGIGCGSFEREIVENIGARAHFLALLTPRALDRVGEPNDWMRREIECAIDMHRNVVPVMLGGFSFDSPEVRLRLTGKLALLKCYNGLEVPARYFESAMDRLEQLFLNVEIDAVLHPASALAQESASKQQAAADRATMGIDPLPQGPGTPSSDSVSASDTIHGEDSPRGESGVSGGSAGSSVLALSPPSAAIDTAVAALPRKGAGSEAFLALVATTESDATGALGIGLKAVVDGREIRARAPRADLALKLVHAGSVSSDSDPQTGRTLFRLLIPSDLRSIFTSSIKVVLQVDAGTACIPWEMLDSRDDEDESGLPWAIRTVLLRQLRTNSFSEHEQVVRTNDDMLVIGEPEVDVMIYPPLPGAVAEVRAIQGQVAATGVVATKHLVVSEHANALAITNALLARHYRIVHVAGYGEPGPNAGVVMSDGSYLGAREIAVMRSVPELVFLNCCHQPGHDDVNTARSYDRAAFAANIAEELIRIGVRCVIAAGWAVEDETAVKFATTFYATLLGGARFIEAVGVARAAAWSANCQDSTWAAYQCYGDPDWRFRGPIDASAQVSGS
jgi:hypothetical protein